MIPSSSNNQKMAETMLFWVAGKILGDVSSPATQKIVQKIGPIFGGIKEDLKKLENTVSSIQAVLLDAEERSRKKTEHHVSNWLEQLDAAIYEADDLLDEFNTEVLRRQVTTRNNKRAKKVRIFFSRSNQLAFRFKVGGKLQKIRERLDAIAADRLRYNFSPQQIIQKDMGVGASSKKRPETDSFVQAEEVIGRDEDKKVIIERLLLLEEDSNIVERPHVSVIPIVGIGGLGKTTLAQLVYNDEEVQNHFNQLRMWVCVSDVFDVNLIAQNILKSATKSDRIEHMATVNDELKSRIDGKKYLLVLDDVWNDDRNKWLQLRELLMGGAPGSKILLTTRMELVAKITGGTAASTHLLKGLSESESWSLFKQMAFVGGVEPENTTLPQLGKEIVKKCVGVPLAIRTLGGLLYVKDTEKEWSYFKDNELSKIPDLSASDGIFPILKLSYDYLPPCLKQCFAYCSVFPKDHVFDKKTLIQLWIVQGFIQPPSDGKRLLEDVGDEYFVELLRRSFFQFYYVYKMHDLIHDLALWVVGGESCAIGLGAENVVERTRHVSIGSEVPRSWEIPNRLVDQANKLRTFLLLSRSQRSLVSGESKKAWCNKAIAIFRRLRVFGLAGLKVCEVPSSIGELRHLKFLDLSDNRFELLPECICRLHNLQTLKLNCCHRLKELPSEIRNLVSLRHLEIGYCDSLRQMPRGLGQLTSLQTLSMFVVGRKDKPDVGIHEQLSDLEGLVNLRGELCIKFKLGPNLGRRTVTSFGINGDHSYLINLEFLETVVLECYNNDEEEEEPPAPPKCEGLEIGWLKSLQPHPNVKQLLIEGFPDKIFPSWSMADYIGLSRIQISRCDGFTRLSVLGLLPSLQFLELDSLDSLEYIYDDEEKEEEEDCAATTTTSTSTSNAKGLFPSLKRLVLSCLPSLESLERRTGGRRGKVVPTATASSSTSSSAAAAAAAALEISSSTSSLAMMQHLPALESLEINACPRFDLLPDTNNIGIQFQGLIRSLTELTLFDRDMESLPVWLQHLTNLQSLTIDNYWKLTTLPEWMGNLRSLQKLTVFRCRELKSFPKGLCRLTSLRELTLFECSRELESRCMKETGEDWTNIAHIPNIYINDYQRNNDRMSRLMAQDYYRWMAP